MSISTISSGKSRHGTDKLRVALINPPDDNVLIGNNPKVLEESRGYSPPLGLLYIGTVLNKDTAHTVQIIDCQVERMNQAALARHLQRYEPDIIGITCMTFTLLDVVNTVKTARKNVPGAIVVLGGPHVHLYPEETARIPGVDFLVTGEGEYVFRDLVEALFHGRNVRNMPGLAFRYGEKVIVNPPPKPVQNLDDLPLPDRRLTAWQKYDSIIGKHSPVTTMFTSRGCPYRCLFCDRPHLGKKFRARSAASVISEFEDCARLGIGEILIYDDTFTIDRERVIQICRGIIDKKINIAWDIRARVNTVDPILLDWLKKAGCQRIHFGVESGAEDILKTLRKDITLSQIRSAFRDTRKAGISTLAYFMFGSPGETGSHIKKSLKLIREIKPDFVHITITTPFPGTSLYRMALDRGLVEYDVWREFAADPVAGFVPPQWNETLSCEELQSFMAKAYRDFYFRPEYLLKQLLAIRSGRNLIRKLRAALRLFHMR